MNTAEQILDVLRQARPEMEERFKVQGIGLFGSVVRGEQQEGSDIDILVELPVEADLLDLIGLGQFLEERLHQRVDVVPKGALRAEIRDRVLSEARYL